LVPSPENPIVLQSATRANRIRALELLPKLIHKLAEEAREASETIVKAKKLAEGQQTQQPDRSSFQREESMVRRFIIVSPKDDGRVESYPMKDWLRRHPQIIPGVDPSNETSHQLRDRLRRLGWSVQESCGEVRLVPPGTADAEGKQTQQPDRSRRSFVIVVPKDDGGVELYPMKDWLRRHPDILPGVNPSDQYPPQLASRLCRLGWSVQETPGEVRLVPPRNGGHVSHIVDAPKMQK
jgi:hypothetical protein